jgi:signal transduction histidine kinase
MQIVDAYIEGNLCHICRIKQGVNTYYFVKKVSNQIANDSSKLHAMLLHQWKQPLGRLSALLQLTLSDISHPDLQNSIETVHKMSEIADSMAALYRRQRSVGNFNLKELLDQCVASFFQWQFNELNVVVQVRVSPEIVLKGDALLFEQILIVLLENACFAIMQKECNGQIFIATWETGTKLYISIADNGKKFKKKNKKNIFKEGISNSENGSGIGLALAMQILTEFFYGTISLGSPDVKTGKEPFLISLDKRKIKI